MKLLTYHRMKPMQCRRKAPTKWSIGNIKRIFWHDEELLNLFTYFRATPTTAIEKLEKFPYFRGTPTTAIDTDEVEEVQPVAEVEDEKPSNEAPTADCSGPDLPQNFANIFTKDENADEVAEKAVEDTEAIETIESVDAEEKKDIDDEAENR